MEKNEELVKAPARFVPDNADKIEGYRLELSAIKEIKTDAELEKANGLVKDSKLLFKQIEASRKSFTSKLDELKTAAMVYEKQLSTAYGPVDTEISRYLRVKEEKRLADLRKIQEEADKKAAMERLKIEQKRMLVDFELNTKQAINDAAKVKDIDEIKKKLEKFEPSEATFGEHLSEAKKLKTALVKLADQQREAIKGKEKIAINLESVKDKREDIETKGAETLQDIDLKAQAQSQSIETVSGIKKVWTFQMEHLSHVPLQYLTVDDAKVKQAIKEGVREIPGIKIFQEISRSGK